MVDAKNNILCLVACAIGGALARLVFRRKPADDIELLRRINNQFTEVSKMLHDISTAQIECNNRVNELSDNQIENNISGIKSILVSQTILLESIISRDELNVNTIKETIQANNASVISAIDKLFGNVDKIPDNIEEITKKYSMYLHDEHVQIYDIVSKQSKFPKTLSLPPSPRISELLRKNKDQSKGSTQSLLPLGQTNRDRLTLVPIRIPKST